MALFIQLKEDTICPLVPEEDTEIQNDELEIEYNGNIITLENGMEIVYVPSNGKCYTYTTPTEFRVN